MEKKLYEFVAITKSATNPNRITGKEEKFHVCMMKELYSIDALGRKYMGSGAVTGKTFFERENGAWVILLDQVEKKEIKLSDLPNFQGYIADEITQPYYVPERDKEGKVKKNPDGTIVLAKYPAGHPDEGKEVIANRFHMLLSADEDLESAKQSFISRQKLVDTTTIDAGSYQSTKAKAILSYMDTSIAQAPAVESAE